MSAADLLRIIDCLNDLAGGDGGGGDDGGGGQTETQRQPTSDLPVDDIGAEEGIGADEGDFPDGGVDSGYGPTGSDDDPGAPLAARGAALLALLGVLATGLVIMRRRRSGS